MNEQFDRALRNHIRDTFDHYDDLMADDGWAKFQAKKNRKRRGLILWYAMPSGIAAALALLWIFNITTNDVVKTESKTVAQNNSISVPNSNATNLDESVENIEPSKTQQQEPLLGKKTIKVKPSLSQNKSINGYVAVSSFESQRPSIGLVATDELYFDGFKTDYKSEDLKLNKQSLIIPPAQQSVANPQYLAFKADLLKNTDNIPKSTISEDEKLEKKKNSNFNFAVDANTFYSFTSAGVNNDLNLGVGVLSELKLSKRLSVNSGISINRQSAVYQNSQQRSSSQNFDSPSSPNSMVSQVSKQSISVPDGVQTNAKLVGFDIPINIKYNLPLGKAKTFITTGVSSYSLLNQSYINDFSVVNYSLTSEPTTTVLRSVEENQNSAFSNFQFARTINFSFGILYPVSIRNSISVEPFVKYPIAGFGKQDLEIGSGGISFKLNFGK